MDIHFRDGRPLSGAVWWLNRFSVRCPCEPIRQGSADTFDTNGPMGKPSANIDQSRRKTHARI